MTTNSESEDAVIVLVELVQDGGPPMMPAPRVFAGASKVRLAEQAAFDLYDRNVAASEWLDMSNADAARARWLKLLKSGVPAPLNCRRSLRWRMVTGER